MDVAAYSASLFWFHCFFDAVRASWSSRGMPTETPTVHPVGLGQSPLTQPGEPHKMRF